MVYRNILWLVLLTIAAGCGGGDDNTMIEGEPVAPEAGSEDYDQYNDAGREGPGGN